MSSTRVRARRGEGDKLREEILVAASALLDETNDETAVSIRAIAERVGVTAPSIYRHFDDKEAILIAVCADVFAQLTDSVGKAAASARTPLDALAAAGRRYVHLGLEHPEHYRLAFMRPPFKDDVLDHTDFRRALETGDMPETHPLFSGTALAASQAFKALYDLVNLVLDGLPKRRRPDVFVVTTAMWTAMHGITSLRISKPDFLWPNLDEQIDTILWPWRELLRPHAPRNQSKPTKSQPVRHHAEGPRVHGNARA
jgi:AcrR family transcriptional regulator